MAIKSSLKHRFFNAFREIFVHHHGSLEFRAKIFSLIIASFENTLDNENKLYDIIRDYGLKLYSDAHRADLLTITTKELVKKVYEHNGLDIDTLITHIQKELRIVPRYAKKIDIDALRPMLEVTTNPDILSYQENILDFLQDLKDDTLYNQQHQIEESEEKIKSKYSPM